MGDRRSRPPAGRHFLRRRIAAELVTTAGIDPSHVVWEPGAGTGVLTRELASRARRVVAVEIDASLASRLRRFDVEVIRGDALACPLPSEPFRAVGNVPFAITTALLHRLLDDPALPLLGADLVVQREAAHKRARPSTLLALSWGPWYEFAVTRELPASCFRPPPSVDAAVLAIRRRREPLLDPRHRDAYVALLHRGFGRGRPLRRELAGVVPGRVFRGLGIGSGNRARDVDVETWVELLGTVDRSMRDR